MVLVALYHQVASRSLAHRLQQIQLLIQPFRPQTNAGFQNLGQPFSTMTRGIDGGTATGYGPAAIQRLDPTHDAREIFRDSQIAAPQLLQGAHPVLSVVHSIELVCMYTIGQFPRIDPITLAAILQQGVSSRIADYKMADVRLQQVM